MDRKFFLLPLDLKQGRNTRITPKFIRENTEAKKNTEIIAKKKKSIFNENLSNLIDKIKDKSSSINANSQDKRNVDLLDKIYTDNESESNAKTFLNTIFFEININSYTTLFLDKSSNTYKPFFSNGIEVETYNNLYLSEFDFVFEDEKDGIVDFNFNSELSQDVFFQKKISENDFKEYSGFILHKVQFFELKLILCLFYKSKLVLDKNELIQNIKSINKKISPLMPYFQSISEEHKLSILDSKDILNLTINTIREKIKNFKQTFYFNYIIIKNYSEINNSIEVKRTILKVLEKNILEGDIIFHINFNKILILSSGNMDEKIISYFKEIFDDSIKLKFETKVFPDYGKNIFLYL